MEGSADRGEATGGLIRLDGVEIERVMTGQRGEDGGRQRAGVILYLTEIADRNSKPRRHGRLAETGALAEGAETFAGEEALAGHGL
jgi:hypothetical protein